MIASVVKFPVIFISGVFIPLAELPTWGQAIAYISPLTYFTDIARISMQGQGHLSIAVDLLALLAFTLLFIFAGMRLHRRTMPRRI
jgi:ABC-2 type transport system permease protein